MEFIFGLLMGTRLFAMLTGGMSEGPEAYFAPPQIIITQSHIKITTTLKKPYPEKLRLLARTSTPILLYTVFELREKGRRKPVQVTTIESILLYDIVAKRYSVTQSLVNDTLFFDSLDVAIETSARYNHIPVCDTKSIKADSRYFLVIYAILGKTRVEALENKSIDLMYYWNYKRPTIKTGAFGGRQLLQKTKP